MNHLIFITATALLATSAAQAADGARVQPKANICKQWGDQAAKIMILRQSETPMNEIMGALEGAGDTSIMQQIVVRAYESPTYTGKEFQDRAIAEFRNRVELECFKSAIK
ncbi:hypothetical protein [Brucella anthropi]|uniref:hypothetical protein n=1 Tax=Brucella anthropi TaxID=529 RepID=UPI00124C068A|nr:hypothetical protein [Brucella anthropi]